jgi:MFS family permease
VLPRLKHTQHSRQSTWRERFTLLADATQHDSNAIHPPAVLAWSIWALASALYAVGFFQRTAPAVMTAELMSGFGITAAALGNLASCYFYAYVVMLIPTGLLTAVYGPRKLLTISALSTGAGLTIYATASSFVIACIGLAIVGGAGAMAMVLALELAGRWLPGRRFAVASALTVVAGVMGAMLAGYPLRLTLAAVGWRTVMLGFGIFAATLAAAIWFVARDDPSEKGYLNYSPTPASRKKASGRSTLAGLGQVFAYRNTWLMLLIPGGITAALLSFSGLWGVPYLRARFGLAPEQAALICSLLLVSFAVGGPVIGLISDRLGRRRLPYVTCVVTAAFGWLTIVLPASLPLPAVITLLVATGFCTGGGVLSYAVGRDTVPPELSGAVTGVVITGIMIGPSIIQPVTGVLLDMNWAGAREAGIRLYGVDTFRSAFLPMLGWTSGAALLVPLVKETFRGERRGGSR